jgi:hypothetical protein
MDEAGVWQGDCDEGLDERMLTAEPVWVETEEEEVAHWRCDVLEQAGYAPPTACVLALRQDVDLYMAVDLARNGCSEQLALRILL